MQFLLWGLLLVLSRPLYAADNMRFSGVLIEPPSCKINEGEVVEVDFEERVGVTKVDGVHYMKKLDYLITCEKWASGLDLTLTLSGKKTLYDDAAIQTNVDDLGIRILKNGEPFNINSSIVVDPKSPPTLQAVPVKTPGASLKKGPFMATATLKVEYQ